VQRGKAFSRGLTCASARDAVSPDSPDFVVTLAMSRALRRQRVARRQRRDGVASVVLGDFNEPSHRD
jgi:hypothetical protein